MKIGDRMKEYEASTTSDKLMKRLPIVARLDGKSFSTFTKGLAKPYDKRFSMLMQEVTKLIVEDTGANCGYTQSDEITLVWYTDDPKKQQFFGGRVFKIIGYLAAKASVLFNTALSKYLPNKAHMLPTFDCRVFNVPTLEEATNCLLWRELDATKNSINLAAQQYYSRQQLFKKNQNQQQEMLCNVGIDWNNYPAYFKRGSYFQKRTKTRKFGDMDLSSLPPKHNARTNPNIEVKFQVVEAIDMPPLMKVTNRVETLLFGETPKLANDE